MSLHQRCEQMESCYCILLLVLVFTIKSMWHKEHHWNFTVLQRVQLSNPVSFMSDLNDLSRRGCIVCVNTGLQDLKFHILPV
jgi:hypothetical protein